MSKLFLLIPLICISCLTKNQPIELKNSDFFTLKKISKSLSKAKEEDLKPLDNSEIQWRYGY